MSPPGLRFDVTRLTHELAHQLAFNSGIQKRGVMYPIWVSEGLATNFECGGLMTGSALPSNTARGSSLATAYAAGELVPLRQFIVQTRVPADVQASRSHYAQAWAFFRFLLTEYPESLREYLYREANQPAGRRDANVMLSRFTDAFGTPESLEQAWNAFVVRQIQSDSTDAIAWFSVAAMTRAARAVEFATAGRESPIHSRLPPWDCLSIPRRGEFASYLWAHVCVMPYPRD